ncbi:S8 family serine peptidase [Novosphingobium sp. 9U]|uniref:S8 family serine peptidase n=1 Tax=Novosphingobium sp. 9U TaxID=2653158 RepID=UPI001359B4F1|nr:S8 family serine peptidase [Novosphingobium sp. 9U]
MTAASLLAADDGTFDAFAAKVAADVDAVLTDFDIPDHATRRRLLTTRSFYEILTGRNEQALATILAIRALEDKPDAKLTSGLREEAILRARIAAGSGAGPAFERCFAAFYREALAALPFPVVGTRLKETKSRAEIQSPGIVAGYIANEVEPAVTRDRAVTDKGADDLLWARTFNRVIAPTTTASIAALRAVIAANTVRKPNIWAAREVTLTTTDPGHPVTVAVWDSGVDVSLFPGRVFAAPVLTGAPNNGHGLSFDLESRPTTGTLRPLTAAQRVAYTAALRDFQGYNDSQAGLDSAASERLHAKLGRMTAMESAAYLEQLSFFGDYIHGTHVAGIVARGNPFVRLAVIRDTFDTRAVPAPPSDASVARRVQLYARVSEWLKANRVRVVNLSWSDSPDSYERDLEKNGLGGTVAQRKALARRYFRTARDAFRQVVIDNPDTLFVAAAGNSNTDTAFEEGYPYSLVAPNLLVISAVDQAGDETSFTSNGSNVTVSANGNLVNSYVPGGMELADSGTSMASPNVANLAAKLIALAPEMTSGQVVALIQRGATASVDGRRRNIDPKASIALLKQNKRVLLRR